MMLLCIPNRNFPSNVFYNEAKVEKENQKNLHFKNRETCAIL
jgi:hypothetical protein